MNGGPKTRPPAERLAKRLSLDEDTGCLNWTGPTVHNGYGRLQLSMAGGKRTRIRAHRLAYELARGPIPAGMEVDHLCRNRRCCNPDHMEIVTREENIARGMAPHMVNARKTHCKRGHEFTAENTRINTKGQRVCRACQALQNGQRPSKAKPRAPKPPPKVLLVPTRDRTHCPKGHAYDAQNTRRDKLGHRYCRACDRERQTATRARSHA